jgi:hypothetical protein
MTYDESDIIKSIYANIGPNHRFPDAAVASGYSYSDAFDLTSFGETAAFYMLPEILTKHGRPGSVLVLTFGGSIVKEIQYHDFDLILTYPEQGILVHYTTKKRVEGSNTLGCVANAHVEFRLIPPGKSESFFAYLEKTSIGQALKNYTPLEDWTSMSIDDFYQTFRHPTDKCITIPNKALPTWAP